MRHHVTYPLPPEKPEQKVPKFEVFIDWSTYTWRAELEGELDEYDGTFTTQLVPGLIHIEWYQMPDSIPLWEAVEEELRSVILNEMR